MTQRDTDLIGWGFVLGADAATLVAAIVVGNALTAIIFVGCSVLAACGFRAWLRHDRTTNTIDLSADWGMKP